MSDSPSGIPDRFDEVFQVELDGWCHGITYYPGEIHSGIVHRIIQELAPSFKSAIEHGYVFDILDLALKFSRAAKYLVDEREICFSILAHLPSPMVLGEDSQFTLAQIVDQAEQAYGSALEKLEAKWQVEREEAEGKFDEAYVDEEEDDDSEITDKEELS